VSSYLNPRLVAAEVLPALSVQVPLGLALAESGPVYVIEVQDAIPDVASLPLQLIPTALLNQPLWSGERAALALTLVGAVASTLSVFVVIVVVPPSLVAEQVRVVPVFGSSMRIAGSQPVVEVIDESGSLTDQWTTMNLPLALPMYQLLFPSVPSIEYATIGGVESWAMKRAAACPGASKAAASPSATYHDVRCTSDLGGEETTRAPLEYSRLRGYSDEPLAATGTSRYARRLLIGISRDYL
jgi:hypothetical protein